MALTPKQNAFIKAAVRKASLHSPERQAVLNLAKQGKFLNTKTNRMSEHYLCAHCGYRFPLTRVQVDHISPIVPITGFDTWDNLFDRLLNGDMQVLCKECHDKKSKAEAGERKSARALIEEAMVVHSEGTR